MMESWFSGARKVSFRCREAVSLWAFATMEDFGLTDKFSMTTTILKKVCFAACTCIFAIGGAVMGMVIGAMKGQTTETGFLRGSGIGAVAGAITAVQLLESMADGEPLSKVALLYSLVDGKVFMEWVSPAVLKAYQSQISAMEATYNDISDIYDTNGVKGVSHDCIQKLPKFTFQSSDNSVTHLCHESHCSICLQEFKDGEVIRTIPYCGHFFHLECLDKWLNRSGSCPMCRNCVCSDCVEFEDECFS